MHGIAGDGEEEGQNKEDAPPESGPYPEEDRFGADDREQELLYPEEVLIRLFALSIPYMGQDRIRRCPRIIDPNK